MVNDIVIVLCEWHLRMSTTEEMRLVFQLNSQFISSQNIVSQGRPTLGKTQSRLWIHAACNFSSISQQQNITAFHIAVPPSKCQTHHQHNRNLKTQLQSHSNSFSVFVFWRTDLAAKSSHSYIPQCTQQ